MRLLKTTARTLLKRLGYSAKKLEPVETIPLDERNVARLLYFERLLGTVAHVSGDIVECGVGRGDSLLMLALLVCAEGKGRTIWAFDSFEGLPEPGVHDLSPRRLRKGELACSIGAVRRLLLDSGLSHRFFDSNMTLVKGYFQETLVTYSGGPIALLHLDVDLYDSYVCALRHLQPRTAPGGVTAFDEYKNTFERLHCPGAQKAIDEHFGEAASRIQRDPLLGKYYFVNDRALRER